MSKLENKEEYIDIFPNLKGINSKKSTVPKKTDPDVDLILNNKPISNNILDSEFQKTTEEQTKTNVATTYFTTWNCIILCLSIIVIVLIIYVAYTNLKSNESILSPNKLPKDMLHPGQRSQMHPQMHPGQPHMYPGQPQMHPGQLHMHPGQRPQTEHLPVHSNTISKPSKRDLMKTLNKIKLETIEEGEEEEDEEEGEEKSTNELGDKNHKKSATSSQLETEQENNGVDGNDDSEQDTELSKKFYENIQENIDIDEMDDNSDNDNDMIDTQD